MFLQILAFWIERDAFFFSAFDIRPVADMPDAGYTVALQPLFPLPLHPIRRMPNACPGFDYRLPLLLGTTYPQLCFACLPACLLAPASTESRSALPPPTLASCSCARKSEMEVRSCCISVAADPWLSTGGARAVLGRVKAFRLARHSGQDSGSLFFWRRCALCLVRLLRFCTGRRVWLATLHLIADCLNVHGLLFFSTATATPDGFGFLRILPMHDRFACQLSTVAERGRRWFG